MMLPIKITQNVFEYPITISAVIFMLWHERLGHSLWNYVCFSLFAESLVGFKNTQKIHKIQQLHS